MKDSVKSKAERQFSASQKQGENPLLGKDKAEKERSDKRTRLAALRLGKDELISDTIKPNN
jgi:hypothetical protein